VQETNNVRRPAPTTKSGFELAFLPFFCKFLYPRLPFEFYVFISLDLLYTYYHVPYLTTLLVLYNLHLVIGVRLARDGQFGISRTWIGTVHGLARVRVVA